MIKVLKASAGSGKTHTLAETYIDMLMRNEDEFAYRHILAVTFTNKATDEMKSRIICDLKRKADSDDPQAAKARRALSNILHDYSAFSVCTIDRFFQRTLRSFARELGNFSGYQVELDKAMLCEQAVAAILDSLNPDDESDAAMVEFIIDSMRDKLIDGKSMDIETELNKMALQLRSEDFLSKSAEMGFDPEHAYSPAELMKLKAVCNKVMGDFEAQIHSGCAAIVEACASIGMDAKDFSGAAKSWMNGFFKYGQAIKPLPFEGFTDSAVHKALDSSLWVKKEMAYRLPMIETAIGNRFETLFAYIDKAYSLYNTATLIMSNLYGLGVAARLSSAFRQIMKENNVVCLDESNLLLKRIIAGSDVPFVYEKVGTAFDHFLLDEFQDTSCTQWENFLPLLDESNSRDHTPDKICNLIVGDVKQSIYRWRQSDWTLLDSQVKKAFPGCSEEAMKKNWRSCRNIIDFNNAFYPKAAQILDSRVGDNAPVSIQKIYSDVEQEVGREDHKGKGYVDIRFLEDQNAQMDDVVNAVHLWHDVYKVPYGKMAVLVRVNKAGTMVAERFVKEGIPVVTESSLSIKNSLTVRRLASLMSYVDNPKDTVGSYLATSLGVEYPKSWHSLAGLCDALYAQLYANPAYKATCEGDSMYVMAFADYIMEYAARQGNDLHEFLRKWQDVDPTISSPLGSDAVNILSIHKSKGLDFQYVILPFVEQIELFHDRTQVWAEAQVQGTEMENAASHKLFLTNLSGKSEGSAFNKAYCLEYFNQCVDAINMMYVATTRAVRGMLILSSHSKEGTIANFADILYSYAGADKKIGEMQEYVGEGEEQGERSFQLSYEINALAGRLSVRPYAKEFFQPSETVEKDGMSKRVKGIVMHDILSRVVVPSDLCASVDAAVAEGSLPEADRDTVISDLSSQIKKHPEIFPDSVDKASGYEVYREATVFGADGKQYRPDRVVISPEKLLVVDYKFGSPRKEYLEQIATYKAIFEQMGYPEVEARLWFVYKNNLH